MILLNRALLILVLLPAFCGCGHHKSVSGDAKTLARRMPTTRELIDRLASRFPPQHEQGYWGGADMFDTAGTDRATKENYVSVQAAYKQLVDRGFAAFGDLIAASDDPRFSYSVVVAAWNNISVGIACTDIVAGQIEQVSDRENYKGMPDYIWDIREHEGLKKWWAEHQNQTLRDLQIECLKWTIAAEKTKPANPDLPLDNILPPLQKRLQELETAD
jgi:hypothetical protein